MEPTPPLEDASSRSRRTLLIGVGSAACALTAIGGIKAVVDVLRPLPSMGPPSQWDAGPRDRITDGTVLFNKEHKLIVVGAERAVYAMSAVCPHLGCMTRLRSDGGLIECACHGSGFDLRGRALSGPSGPLHWLKLQLGRDNRLVVDTAVQVPAGTMLNL